MKITYTPPASAEDAIGLPVDQLGMHLLRGIANSNPPFTPHGLIQGAKQAYSHNNVEPQLRTAAVLGLSEALDWLRHAGLVAPDPDQSDSFLFITRLGRQALAASDGLALVGAQRRLDVELHPRIADRIRSQFRLGEYELAAFAALREVEIRVRELAEASDSDIGVKLMRHAFGNSGPLADPALEGGERDALSSLYAGAIGVFKNPSSHRQVTYSDPTVASEVILLGDLLLRMLDSTAARLGKA